MIFDGSRMIEIKARAQFPKTFSRETPQARNPTSAGCSRISKFIKNQVSVSVPPVFYAIAHWVSASNEGPPGLVTPRGSAVQLIQPSDPNVPKADRLARVSMRLQLDWRSVVLLVKRL